VIAPSAARCAAPRLFPVLAKGFGGCGAVGNGPVWLLCAAARASIQTWASRQRPVWS